MMEKLDITYNGRMGSEVDGAGSDSKNDSFDQIKDMD